MSCVIGLGAGDEGKGQTVSWLCSKTSNPLVVRFNGGHQAGHNVIHEGKSHIFSSFGSGTLQGIPTYWDKHCTFYPTAMYNEWQILKEKGIDPILIVHPLCPVTTPYDVEYNQLIEKTHRDGSVGVGFGATLQREQEHYHLFVQDLFHPIILKQKLNLIAKFYGKEHQAYYKDEAFLFHVLRATQLIKVQDHFESMFNPIYEGGQGILLDQRFGFFPNVTRSNCTTENIKPNDRHSVMYVTRTYQTRHGNGFMTNEDLPEPILINAENETNKPHEFQGQFRKTVLDVNLLRYSLQCDKHFSERPKSLMITCVDQTGKWIHVTDEGVIKRINVVELGDLIEYKGFDKIFIREGLKITEI